MTANTVVIQSVFHSLYGRWEVRAVQWVQTLTTSNICTSRPTAALRTGWRRDGGPWLTAALPKHRSVQSAQLINTHSPQSILLVRGHLDHLGVPLQLRHADTHCGPGSLCPGICWPVWRWRQPRPLLGCQGNHPSWERRDGREQGRAGPRPDAALAAADR